MNALLSARGNRRATDLVRIKRALALPWLAYAASAAFSQTIEVSPTVIAGGGQTVMTGTDGQTTIEVGGTIGQPAVDTLIGSNGVTTIEITGGFWPVAYTDCNQNGLADGDELALFPERDVFTRDVNGGLVTGSNGVPDDCEADILYVDDSAAGDATGVTWANAYSDLQDALRVARSPESRATQIWVAAGVYRPGPPTTSGGARTATFQLVDDVALRGGFAGTEPATFDLTQRDFGANASILSGDLNGDTVGFSNVADNAYHVLVATGVGGTAVLDGFTIRGGNADATGIPNADAGGGMLILDASPTVRNCRFELNQAILGGALASLGVSGPRIESACVFADNRNRPNSGVAASDGGAIYHAGDLPLVVRDSLITNNNAVRYGGGLALADGAAAGIVACSFAINSSILKGGSGGGVYAGDSALLSIYNTRFADNFGMTGGALQVLGADVLIFGSLFVANRDNNTGSAIYASVLNAPATVTMVNCTVVDQITNDAALRLVGSGSTMTIDNSVIWGNGDGSLLDQLRPDSFGAIIVNYSSLQGWTVGGVPGTGSSGADPLFAASGEPYALSPGSPAIDAGDNAVVIALPDLFDVDGDGSTADEISLDLLGNPRRVDDPAAPNTGVGPGPLVDRGALEVALEDRFWSTSGGAFATTSNWAEGSRSSCQRDAADTPPDQNRRAIFDTCVPGLQPVVGVNINAAAEAYALQALVPGRNVRLDLDPVGAAGGDVTLFAAPGAAEPGILVSGPTNAPAELTLTASESAIARLVAAGNVQVAPGQGRSGVLEVRRPNVTLALDGELTIGAAGVGVMRVLEGAAVQSDGLVLGAQANSDGSLLISGAGSELTYAGPAFNEFVLGGRGEVDVTITAGGRLGAAPSGMSTALVAADESGSRATLRVEGADSTWEHSGDFIALARGGRVDLTIEAEAELLTQAQTLELATETGALANVLVRGAGTRWRHTGNDIQAGIDGEAYIRIEDGGRIELVGAVSGLNLNDRSVLTGDGTVAGNVNNLGLVAPRATSAARGSGGTLTFDGDYRQFSTVTPAGQPVSGRLSLGVAGASPGAADQLTIGGTAALGGGLFVEFVDGFEPGGTTPFALPVLQAAAIDPQRTRFDVAFFPGIPGNRFLNLSYAANARGAGVQIVDLPLSGTSELDDPDSASVSGIPTAVAVTDQATYGDLNGDLRDDIVVAVPGPSGQPGQIVILLTNSDYGATGVYQPAVQAPTVGIEPAAIAIADFDGDALPDIAVANAGDDNVQFFRNLGGGSFSLIPVATVSVDAEPRALVAADFDDDSHADLAVACAGASTVVVLRNETNDLRRDDAPRGLAQFVWAGPVIIFLPNPTGVRPTTISPWRDGVSKGLNLAVAVGDQQSGAVVLLSNATSGSDIDFVVEPVRFQVGAEPVRLLTADLDSDGDLFDDLATVNRGDGTVSILIQRPLVGGVSEFAAAVSVPLDTANAAASDPRDLTLLDLDNDGDDDFVALVSAAGGQRIARVLRNDLDQPGGQLAFSLVTDDLAAGSQPFGLGAGDLDGDTLDDLVAVGSGGANAETGAPLGLVQVRPHVPSVAGDMNCDGALTVGDIGGFVLALTDPAGYAIAFPNCDIDNADLNADGLVTVSDIGPFVAALTGGLR